MTSVSSILIHQQSKAEAMEAEAEMKERQSIELSYEAMQLRHKASLLRGAIAWSALLNAGEEE